VKVPAGVSRGNYITLAEEGNVGMRGGPPGDVIVFIEEEPHEEFEREGDDLYRIQPVSYATAALGGAVEVPTLDGRARLKIPAGTQSGKILRMRGKGLPHLNGYGKGDMLVEVVVWVPTRLSGAEKRQVEELKQLPELEPGEEVRRSFQKRSRG
jgi:molecular chaperone DnaJ